MILIRKTNIKVKLATNSRYPLELRAYALENIDSCTVLSQWRYDSYLLNPSGPTWGSPLEKEQSCL